MLARYCFGRQLQINRGTSFVAPERMPRLSIRVVRASAVPRKGWHWLDTRDNVGGCVGLLCVVPLEVSATKARNETNEAK